MGTIQQVIEQRQKEVEQQVRRERVKHWLNSCADFRLAEEWIDHNSRWLKVTIEIPESEFIAGKKPRVDYEKQVHID